LLLFAAAAAAAESQNHTRSNHGAMLWKQYAVVFLHYHGHIDDT